MKKPNKTTRFLALMLISGGALGVAIVVVLGLQLASQSLILVVPMLVFLGLFGWAAYTGFRLWQGADYGLKWSPIIFAMQIPILASPALTFNWFTGVQVGPVFQFGESSLGASFMLNLGANGEFYIGQNTAGWAVGVNLFAVVALLLLLLSNRSDKSQPAQADTQI